MLTSLAALFVAWIIMRDTMRAILYIFTSLRRQCHRSRRPDTAGENFDTK
ncbi:MAG: hypothetical protein VX733_03810 [Candidatus Latescibacterota bacterium]|nr:hypothetical protein [Candidatus Latescibacterota bacterium]